MLVGEWTTLVVLGKSKISHDKRIEHIRDNVEKYKSALSTANSKIGKIVIETFSDENELSELLPSALDRAFRGEL